VYQQDIVRPNVLLFDELLPYRVGDTLLRRAAELPIGEAEVRT
jgi:hypothetical protein